MITRRKGIESDILGVQFNNVKLTGTQFPSLSTEDDFETVPIGFLSVKTVHNHDDTLQLIMVIQVLLAWSYLKVQHARGSVFVFKLQSISLYLHAGDHESHTVPYNCLKKKLPGLSTFYRTTNE